MRNFFKVFFGKPSFLSITYPVTKIDDFREREIVTFDFFFVQFYKLEVESRVSDNVIANVLTTWRILLTITCTIIVY